MDPFEQPPSPAKNFLGGSGCGCGCLGMILALVGVVFIGALSFGYVSYQSAGTIYVTSGISLATGALLVVIGVLLWVISVVVD